MFAKPTVSNSSTLNNILSLYGPLNGNSGMLMDQRSGSVKPTRKHRKTKNPFSPIADIQGQTVIQGTTATGATHATEDVPSDDVDGGVSTPPPEQITSNIAERSTLSLMSVF